MVRGTRLLPLHLASADVQAGVVLHDSQSVHSSVCGCGGSTAPPPLSTHSAPTHLSLLSGARATLPDHDSVRIATNIGDRLTSTSEACCTAPRQYHSAAVRRMAARCSGFVIGGVELVLRNNTAARRGTLYLYKQCALACSHIQG